MPDKLTVKRPVQKKAARWTVKSGLQWGAAFVLLFVVAGLLKWVGPVQFTVTTLPTATATEAPATSAATEALTEPAIAETALAVKVEDETLPKVEAIHGDVVADSKPVVAVTATKEPVVSEWDQEFDSTLPLANWYSVTEGGSTSPVKMKIGTKCVEIQAGWAVSTPIRPLYESFVRCEGEALKLSVENLPAWLAVVPRGGIEKPSVIRSIVDGFAISAVEKDRETMKIGKDVKITRVCGLNKVENGVTYYRVVVGYDKSLTSQENQESGQCITVVDKGENVKKVTLRFIGQLADTLEDGTELYKVTLPEEYKGNLLGKLPMERK